MLFLATDYPPLAGTNTQRVQSLVRHLPVSGWEPWVITRALADLPRIDPAELDWPETHERVIRVSDPDPFAWLARRRGRAPHHIGASGAEPALRSGRARAAAKPSWLRLPLDWASTAAKTVLRWGAYHPDALRLWADRAARVALAHRRQIRPDVLITSHPAYSTHMAGLAIKRRIGLPWVADFRDLWVDRPYRAVHSALHAAIDRRCEAAVLRACDHLVLASPAWVDRLAARHGQWLREKCTVITNGFDSSAAVVTDVGLWPVEARLKLAWTGAMFESESPAAFIEALGRIRAEEPELMRGLAVLFAGYGGEHEAELRERVLALRLDGVIRFVGVQAHSAALALQRSADGLLLALGPGHHETLQGKLFEYLAAGRPILAMHPADSVGAALVTRAAAGNVVAFGDVEGIQATLKRWLVDGPPRITPDLEYIAQFDRAILARRYASVLDAVIAQQPLARAQEVGA